MSVTLNVRIEGLTPAQAEAVESLLFVWASVRDGRSRWTAFFADGDGNWRPEITVNDRAPRHTAHVSESELWEGDEYRMDFDRIAWAMRAPVTGLADDDEPGDWVEEDPRPGDST